MLHNLVVMVGLVTASKLLLLVVLQLFGENLVICLDDLLQDVELIVTHFLKNGFKCNAHRLVSEGP